VAMLANVIPDPADDVVVAQTVEKYSRMLFSGPQKYLCSGCTCKS